MLSIVTLTMNPALDESTSVAYVLPDRKLRCQAPAYEPGGGGINVARAVRKLGGDALACFPVAGPAGELLKRLLDAEGVRQTLEETEWPGFLDWLRQLGPPPAFIVASGSLPPGVPVDFYARVAAVARDMGSRLVLDTSGVPLARAVDQGVHLLKPSLIGPPYIS
jgi:6-phosphofructokinase 2